MNFKKINANMILQHEVDTHTRVAIQSAKIYF